MPSVVLCMVPLLGAKHSTTTRNKFYSILTPNPLEWTKTDILHIFYPLYRDPLPLLVHVVIE